MFKLTDSAIKAIENFQQELGEQIPMITWVTDSSFENGKWELGGFFEKDDPRLIKIQNLEGINLIHEISGIKFIVDGPLHYLDLLEGATLDYTDGKFKFS